MISQVEVANPGFSEALISLAGLGRAIDQSIRQVVAVPVAARLAPVPQTSSSSGHAGSGEPSAFAMPAIPGLDSVQALAQAIADALNATLVQSLNSIASAISDCCAEIGNAVSELTRATGVLDAISKTLAACKCQDIGQALKRELEPMKRALNELGEFDFLDALGWAMAASGLALGVLAFTTLAPPVAIGLGLGLGGLILGGWGLSELLDDPSSEEDQESLDELRERGKWMREHPIDQVPTPFRRNSKGFRNRALEDGIREYEEILGRLRERIEDPEADSDLKKELDKEDALRALPMAREGYLDMLDQYKGDYWNDPQFNHELRRWLEDFRQEGKSPTPGTETPRHEESEPGKNPPRPDGDEDQRLNPGLPPGDWNPVPLPPIGAGQPNPYQLAAFSPGDGPEGGDPTVRDLLEAVLHRLSQPLRIDPVRLEVRLLDDRVIARRLDGNRSVDVDLTRGYRMVGYISV